MNRFYKGFVETIGKKPKEKIKNRTDFKTLEDVQDLDGYGGILNDDIIMVDVDEHDMAYKLLDIIEDLDMNVRCVATTRGIHFLFKNTNVQRCSTESTLALGIKADIKIGSTCVCEPLKIDGIKRNDGIYTYYDEQELAELPIWLMPIKSKINIWNMDESEGRNQTLFNYILTLQSNEFSKEQIKLVFELINKYIFKKPLPKNELETILRDESFQKPIFFTEKGQFLHDSFARFLINSNHIIRINGVLYTFNGEVYVDASRMLEHQMIKLIPSLRANQRVEVLKYINVCLLKQTKMASTNYIAFKNGVLNMKTMELLPFDSSIVIINQIPHDYNPNAYDQITDDTLNRIACNDKQIRALLEELVGYCYLRRNDMSKAFMLVGGGSNGKSTYLKVVNEVLGDGNCSALDLSELDKRFIGTSVVNKLANIGDDISDDFLKGTEVSTFKKVVSGSKMKFEFKGQDVFESSIYAKFVFSANSIPKIRDNSDNAIVRRLVIIPFNANFNPNDKDYRSFIVDDLLTTSALEYMAYLGVNGLKRVLTTGFTKSEKSQSELDEFAKSNNNILMWLDEVETNDIVDHTTDEAYLNYSSWCNSNKCEGYGKTNFIRKLLKLKPNYKSEARKVGDKTVKMIVSR